jgi:hypothetical protein
VAFTPAVIVSSSKSGSDRVGQDSTSMRPVRGRPTSGTWRTSVTSGAPFGAGNVFFASPRVASAM